MNHWIAALQMKNGSDELADTLKWADQLKNYMADPHLWTSLLLVIGKIIVILIAGRIAIKLLTKAIEHMMVERQRTPLKFDPRRTRTIGKLVSNVSTYSVNFIMILLVLNQLGFNLAPLLAGAGVLGLAIGFGAQNLVKDVITGFFIIFEDQFGVGDVIQLGSVKGTVEEIGLRVTRIRCGTGEVHIVPNGSIQQVTNYSVYNSVAVADISIAYEKDVDAAILVMQKTLKILYENESNLVKEPEVLGVQTLGASDVVIRITAECKPTTDAAVARIIRAKVKKALESSDRNPVSKSGEFE